MKRLAIWILSALAASGPLSAAEDSWYFGLEGGLENDGQFNQAKTTGGAFLGTVGRRVASSFAIEGELGYRTTSEPTFWTPENADIDQLSLMVNAAYIANVTNDFSLIVAVGAGLDRLSYTFPGGGPFLPFEEDDIKLAVQLKLSAEVALTDVISATASYRAMYAYENEFSSIDNSTVTVGLKFAL